MSTTHQITLKDDLLTKRNEILKHLKDQVFVIKTRDNWWDAFPDSYLDHKQLQTQITTLHS